MNWKRGNGSSRVASQGATRSCPNSKLSILTGTTFFSVCGSVFFFAAFSPPRRLKPLHFKFLTWSHFFDLAELRFLVASNLFSVSVRMFCDFGAKLDQENKRICSRRMNSKNFTQSIQILLHLLTQTHMCTLICTATLYLQNTHKYIFYECRSVHTILLTNKFDLQLMSF